VRSGDCVYVVAIKGSRTSWLRNLLANPKVELRLRGGTFDGTAREIVEDPERGRGRAAYCGTHPGLFERLEYVNWRTGRPTERRIRELHEHWFDSGTPLIIELSDADE
jgi:deazaflavin-dependent oxidoreductase (nitroreductase family)